MLINEIDGVVIAQSQTDTTLINLVDSTLLSTEIDSSLTDSSKVPEKEPPLKSKVEYSASDSMRFNVPQQKVYLYGEANVKYETTELSAAYIELDLKNNTISATGVEDTTGELSGKPIFIDKGKEFSSETMKYNFKTKKGKVTKAITQEGEGYVHGEEVKMQDEDVIFIRNGKYTTCDEENPHFHIQASKLKFIKDDKIVTGPAYLMVEDVPTPLAVPFGFFPNNEDRNNGIIIPKYGNQPELGYNLTEGGYYLSYKDYADLALLGNIYSRGSYGMKVNSNYKLRYKFNGYFNVEYNKIKRGEQAFKDIPGSTYNETSSFFVRWKHRQDTKARPGVTFSADVNAGSQNNFVNRLNSDAQDFVATDFKSNIMYNKRWVGKPISFGLAASHNQNRIDSSLTINFPEATFALTTIYPLSRKVKVGKEKYYEKIGIAYTGVLKNRVKTTEDLFINHFDSTMKSMENGMQHTIPIRTSVKVAKYFTISPNFTYRERWYLKSTEKSFETETVYNPVTEEFEEQGTEVTREVDGFSRVGDYSTGASISTKLYGMYMFKSDKIKAIRHVVIPSVSFNFTPDFTNDFFNIYDSYMNTLTQERVEYSKFESGIYGYPQSKSSTGSIGIKLNNNVEMKVASKRDTVTGDKKIKLLDIFDISSRYDVFADSLKWSDVNISGSTKLAKNISMNFSSAFDPYAIDSIGGSAYEYNKSHFTETGQLARLTRASLTLRLTLQSKNDKSKKKKVLEETEESDNPELEMIKNNPDQFVDFNVPWSINLDYNIGYNKNYFDDAEIRQIVDVSGRVGLTQKWQVGFQTGYDIVNRDISYTSISIDRDLHCWELSGMFVPFGTARRYEITLRVKSSTLQDLKLNRKRNSLDQFQ